jgi:hypothetical protein
MSLPNAVTSGQKIVLENAQSNTLRCKENMNLGAGSEKAGTRWREDPLAARKNSGEGSGQIADTLPRHSLHCAKD